MHLAHPFEKGNGISMRIWLDNMFKHEIYRVVDWTKVDKEEYLLAMENCSMDDTDIKRILKYALTFDIDNRKIYMNGIDQSYNFEGINRYKTEECK